MWIFYVFFVFCLGRGFQCQTTITLKRLSSVYLPYSLDKDGQTDFSMGDRGAVEKFSYDFQKYLVYAAGKAGILNVLDISTPSTPRVLHRQKLPGQAIGIDLCGDHLAVTLTGESLVDTGKVLVYRKYSDGQTSMELVQDIPVGSRPDSVKFTKDCRRLVVGNEAPAGEDASGNFVDPEGSVMLIDFGSEDIGSVVSPDVRTADFRKFDALGDFYQSSGVRWLLKELTVSWNTPTIPPIITNSSFYRTLEPEYITLNEDESKAYICLQTNNAIAVLDMATATFDNIYPLGTKYWGVSSLDASDDDGGIRFQNWPIYGLRQPDAISYFVHGNTGYIVTANEGSPTKASFQGVLYDEQLTGEGVYEMDLLSSSFTSERLKEAINDESELGCLRFSSVDGLDPTEPSKLSRLHTFGGRGVSIFRAEDLSLVWDSGDDLERMEAKFYPEIFNSRYKKQDERPTDQFDDRSCKRGPEPQSLTVGRLGKKTILFIGAEKTGSVFIYSLDTGEQITPTFQSVYWGGRADLTWEEAYRARQVGDTDVEDMSFVPGDKSPNGKPLLLVAGTSSGTVSVYEVMESVITAGASTQTTDLYLGFTTILCLLVISG